MPQSIYEALTLASKTGFITRKLWVKHYATGKQRWANRQLRYLVEQGYLQEHPNSMAQVCLLSTKLGRFVIGTNGELALAPPAVQQIEHDEFVASSLVTLQRGNLITRWLCESELRQLKMHEWKLERTPTKLKYPDAIMFLNFPNRSFQCALEYERSDKSLSRYRDILRRYGVLNDLQLILFVCETQVIKRRIKRQLVHLNNPSLSKRVALVLACDWTSNPMTAPLENGLRSFSLLELWTFINERSNQKDSPEDSPG